MTTVLYILLFVMAITLMMVSLFYVRECNRSKYFKELLIKILNNDDIVKESIATVAVAYDIEEGDLMDYISKKGKQS